MKRRFNSYPHKTMAVKASALIGAILMSGCVQAANPVTPQRTETSSSTADLITCEFGAMKPFDLNAQAVKNDKDGIFDNAKMLLDTRHVDAKRGFKLLEYAMSTTYRSTCEGAVLFTVASEDCKELIYGVPEITIGGPALSVNGGEYATAKLLAGDNKCDDAQKPPVITAYVG